MMTKSETSSSNYETSPSYGQRPGQYTNKGLIVDTYVRQNQDWIVPRRVMCAFFWTGIILLFTGIILLVTSKHKKGAYQSWGAVLLGLGFCLLLICLILCMHAYCVITVSDEEPAMVLTVPPPPPSVLTLANGKSTADSNIETVDSRTHDGLSYRGSTPYHEQKASLCEEKIYSKPESIKDTSSYHGTEQSSEISPSKLIGNGEKRTLAQVGKLPSYSTAIKMPPYAPEKRLSDNPDVDIGYLKEDVKTPTLEKKRPGLRKSVTFDDSTGDVRMEFAAADYDEGLSKSAKPPSPVSSMSHHTRPFLGSPPYDNEPEFQSLPAAKVLSTIPEAPSSPSSDMPAVAATTTTWSHIHPKPQVSLLKVATSQVGDGSSAYNGACQSHHMVTSTVDATSPSLHVCSLVGNVDINPTQTSLEGPHSEDLQGPPDRLLSKSLVPPHGFFSEETSDPLQGALEHQEGPPDRRLSQRLVPPHGFVSEDTSGAEGDTTAVTLRKPLTVQLSGDSSASSKLSVYDNVNYAWKSKSGSEIKHYHF